MARFARLSLAAAAALTVSLGAAAPLSLIHI